VQTDGHYITQGPLQFVGPAAPRAVADKEDAVEKKSDTLAAGKTTTPLVVLPPVRPSKN